MVVTPDRFTQLYDELDATTSTAAKEAALVRYFQEAEPADAVWALFFLTGGRLPRGVTNPQLRAWAAQVAGLPEWLVAECRDAVGDQSETLALLIPEPAEPRELPLHELVEQRLAPLKKLSEPERREVLLRTWGELTTRQRFLFHKLMGGAFRVGAAKTLVIRALAKVASVSPAIMAHRLMGHWQATPADFARMLAPETDVVAGNPGKPYPFFLAHPLPGSVEELGSVEDWQIEWKWDGIRAQLIRRQGQTLLWSRGEELITDRFPELSQAASRLAEGTVLDGEVLAWHEESPLPFGELQKRIGRKKVDAKIQSSVPVAFLAYDLLEEKGNDLRTQPLTERRGRLETLFDTTSGLVTLRLSPLLAPTDWLAVAVAQQAARERGVEGLMLKRRSSPYRVGRVKGDWWKWKTAPLTVDAVLIYAQTGSGRRANLFTDYTFGVWHEGQLVSVAKAYSGLTKEEIEAVDRFIRANTLGKQGPIRMVKAELVFELAFEGIQESKRHKAGVALRFPRIHRWRQDKPAAEADTLATLRGMLDPKKVIPTATEPRYSRGKRRLNPPEPTLFPLDEELAP